MQGRKVKGERYLLENQQKNIRVMGPPTHHEQKQGDNVCNLCYYVFLFYFLLPSFPPLLSSLIPLFLPSFSVLPPSFLPSLPSCLLVASLHLFSFSLSGPLHMPRLLFLRMPFVKPSHSVHSASYTISTLCFVCRSFVLAFPLITECF